MTRRVGETPDTALNEITSLNFKSLDSSYAENKWRSIGTTTRLGGHRDESKREGWFEEIDREQLYSILCEFSRLLPKNGHAWVFADNEVQSIIQGYVREGETGFDYVKSYPVLKMRGDGQAPRMGMGYHLKATTEFVVLCEKGRRRWSNELNNRPDYFMVPWTGDAETRGLTKDGKPYPTAKPWMLYRWLVQLSSSEGETVLDPFAGSGPLATAALAEKRKAVLIDKSADAIEVIRKRIDPERNRRELEKELGVSELSNSKVGIHGSRNTNLRAGSGDLFDVGL